MAKKRRQIHVRRKINSKDESEISSTPDLTTSELEKLVDFLVYASVIILPLLSLPQLLRIWITRSASGVSPLTWFGFSIFAIVWIFYGHAHKEKPIFYLNILLLIMDVAIGVSTLIFGT